MENTKEVITIITMEDGAYSLSCTLLPEQTFTATSETLDDMIRTVAETALNRPGEDFAVNEYFTVVKE